MCVPATAISKKYGNIHFTTTAWVVIFNIYTRGIDLPTKRVSSSFVKLCFVSTQ